MIEAMKHAVAFGVCMAIPCHPAKSTTPTQPPIKSDVGLDIAADTSATRNLSVKPSIDVPELSDDELYEMSRVAREQWARENPY